MVDALKALGVELEERWDQAEMVVHGCAGQFPAQGAELFLGNAGTAMRCANGHYAQHSMQPLPDELLMCSCGLHPMGSHGWP